MHGQWKGQSTSMIPARNLPSDRDNCLRRCVASLLELDTVAVPHFVGEQAINGAEAEWHEPGRWLHSLDAWLKPRGLVALHFKVKADFYAPCYWIAIGEPRGSRRVLHAVVMFGDELVHDPSPGSGIKKPLHALILAPIDAARFNRHVKG